MNTNIKCIGKKHILTYILKLNQCKFKQIELFTPFSNYYENYSPEKRFKSFWKPQSQTKYAILRGIKSLSHNHRLV